MLDNLKQFSIIVNCLFPKFMKVTRGARINVLMAAIAEIVFKNNKKIQCNPIYHVMKFRDSNPKPSENWNLNIHSIYSSRLFPKYL